MHDRDPRGKERCGARPTFAVNRAATRRRLPHPLWTGHTDTGRPDMPTRCVYPAQPTPHLDQPPSAAGPGGVENIAACPTVMPVRSKRDSCRWMPRKTLVQWSIRRKWSRNQTLRCRAGAGSGCRRRVGVEADHRSGPLRSGGQSGWRPPAASKDMVRRCAVLTVRRTAHSELTAAARTRRPRGRDPGTERYGRPTKPSRAARPTASRPGWQCRCRRTAHRCRTPQ